MYFVNFCYLCYVIPGLNRNLAPRSSGICVLSQKNARVPTRAIGESTTPGSKYHPLRYACNYLVFIFK